MTSTIFWPENPLVRLLIIGLWIGFIWGIVQTYRALIRINHERDMIRMLHKRSDLLEDNRKINDNLGKPEGSLGGRLLRAMVSQQGLAFARAADSLEPILDAAARILGPARSIPNLLLLLGLIGTVVGLAKTLGSLDIQNSIKAGDPQAVAQGLGTTLREMSGAFAGTFWGVLGAFLLQAANAFTAVKAEALAEDLDELALHYAPKIYPAGMEHQLKSLQDILRQSDQFLTQTQQKISETSEKFAAVLTEAGGVIRESLDTLQTTSDTIGKALMTASGDVRQSSEKLSTAVKAIESQQQDFRNIYSSFNEMFERSMAALKLHSDSELQVIRDLQGEFGLVGADIAKEILGTAQKLDQVSQDIAAAQSSYQNGTLEVGNSLKTGFLKLDQQLGDTLKLYTTEVNVVSSRLDSLNAGLKEVQDAAVGLTKMLGDKDSAEVTRHRDLVQSEQRLMSSTNRLNEQLEAVLPALQELNPAEVLSREFLKLGQQQVQSTQSQLEGLKQLSDTFSKAATSREEAEQAVQTQLREMSLLFTGLLDLGARAEEHAGAVARKQTEGLEQQLEAWKSLEIKLEEWGKSQQQAGQSAEESQQQLSRLLGSMQEQAGQYVAELKGQRAELDRLISALETHTAISQRSASALGEQLGHTVLELGTQLQEQHAAQHRQQRELLTDLGASLRPALVTVPATEEPGEAIMEGAGQT